MARGRKRSRRDEWFPIETFRDDLGSACLIWWQNSYSLIWKNDDAWVNEAGERPFESQTFPTHWAYLLPPPREAIMELLEEMRKDGKLPDPSRH